MWSQSLTIFQSLNLVKNLFFQQFQIPYENVDEAASATTLRY